MLFRQVSEYRALQVKSYGNPALSGKSLSCWLTNLLRSIVGWFNPPHLVNHRQINNRLFLRSSPVHT